MTMTVAKRHTKTKTKCFKDPSHGIFLKSGEFKDIRYDAYNDKDNDQKNTMTMTITKTKTKTKVLKTSTFAIFLKS